MTTTLGFLTVRRHQQHGYFGGYLVVNALARPLEFHCTLPVQPSRAQSVLYGPTLDDFMCGEQIAKALITKAKIKPDLVFTDSRSVLAVCLVTDLQVVALESADMLTPVHEHLSLPTRSLLQYRSMEIGRHVITVAEQSSDQWTSDQWTLLKESLNQLVEKLDLSEPFSRVVEALAEAHPAVKAA
jgi:hypothetical protein